MQTEELARCCYGVEIRLVDAAGLDLCQRLRETLPPEFVSSTERAAAVIAYEVTAAVPCGGAGQPEYLVTCDGVEVFATATKEEVYWWLRQDIDQAVARRSPRLLFVHAGVVGWRGVAIVIPGRGPTGKSTLVAELVRRGATYYSDAFAVLDESGRVHPYRGAIGPGAEDQPHDLRLVQEDVLAEPLPISLVVAGAYRSVGTWRPSIVRGAHAALPLVDSTVVAREHETRMVQLVARVASSVVTLRGPRPEATEVAAQLLDLVDDAFVSHAIDAAENGSSRMTDDLARVAEIRLQSQTGRPVSPPRRLVAARYVRVTEFLSTAEHQRLLERALACEADFQESGIIGSQGENALDYGFRKSRTLWDPRLEELWSMFDQPLRAILPAVRLELDIPWFSLGEIERQLTAHSSGGFFAPHVDTGDASVASRRISCVYHFHASPRRFTGGELKLYDTWVTPTGSTGAATYTTLTPLDNSLVFFPSDAFHEVCPVHPETDTFSDCRFAITIWLREGQWQAAMDGDEARS